MYPRINTLRWLGALAVACALFSSVSAFNFILNDDTGLPIKWPAGTLRIQIMLGTTANLSDGNSFNSSAQAAIGILNSRMGSLQIVGTSAAAGSATNHNNVNELAFADDVYGKAFETNVLAVTTGYSSGNESVESDTLFNKAKPWDSYLGPIRSKFDLRRVALHEIGHALGLDHPDEATPPQNVTAIMNSHIGDLDTLADDDITALQLLYGPPGVPANDAFANAITLTLNSDNKATVHGYNTNATKETGEPKPVGNSGGHSIWWKWSTPTAGTITVDTKGSYSDTVLGIYTGTAASALTEIASNDDINPGIVQASLLVFQAQANTPYYFLVDGFDGDSSAITLNAEHHPGAIAPSFTAQPTDLTVNAGENASFSVTATGPGTLTYQWFFGSAPSTVTTSISGATSATLSLPNAQAANNGYYLCAVANSSGQVASRTVKLTVITTPVITTQPASQSVTTGGSVTFSVVATGPGPLTYQWTLGGAAISNATNSSLGLTNVTAAQAGAYAVKVTNTFGSATSSDATLTVTTSPPPSSGGGGGGGGGAPSPWFIAVLVALGLGRLYGRRAL